MLVAIVTAISGEVIGAVSCADIDVAGNTPSGCIAVPLPMASVVAHETHFLHPQSGLVLYTDAQKLAKADRPHYASSWSNQTFSWDDSRTFEERRANKWAQVKAFRAAAIDAPLATPYGTFDSYAEARGNISDAVLLAQTLASMAQPVAINFTLADNTVVALDLAKMVTVGLMLGAKVQSARATATNLRAAIEAAVTVQQLEAIQWPA